MGNPFFKQLISFDFNFAADDELVDYYVNFLKTLTLKIAALPDAIDFFFNPNVKIFPLFEQAVQFFNHKETLVRTSIRTIALTLLSIDNPKM